MMRIFTIGGNHPRHLFYVNAIQERFPIAGSIIEVRENLLPQAPDGLEEGDRDNFVRHFRNRAMAEEKYFGEQSLPNGERLEVQHGGVNSDETADFARCLKPDIVLIFGCGLIKDPLCAALPKDSINMHLGLSPRYRGAATLFWPFYFLEPAYAGCTFHYIVDEPDAGSVIHQTVPELLAGDGIHDVACKAIVAGAQDAVRLLEVFSEKGAWSVHQQRATGKNFLESDFKPQHLRMIYDVYDDDVVDHYLSGDLVSKQPKLFRQF